MLKKDQKAISIRLKEKREKITDSLRKFAIDANIDPSQYAKIEKGELPLTENVWNKIASVYNIDEKYVWHGINVPHGNQSQLATEEARQTISEPYYRYRTNKPREPMAIIDQLVHQQESLVRSHERLTLANERLVERMLTSLDESDRASELSSVVDKVPHNPVEQEDILDKPGIDLKEKKRKQKDTFSEKNKRRN